MEYQGQVLSAEERREIHEKAITILETVGIRYPDGEVLDLLESLGARVDREGQLAFLSRNMVESALAGAPRSFVLGARNPEYDLPMPAPHPVLNLDGTGVYAVDAVTGQRRYGNLDDIEKAAKVFESIPLGRVLWPPIVASDAPGARRNLLGTAASFLHCSKHVQDEVKHPSEIPPLLELLGAVLGDRSRIAERNIYSVTYCTVAPLMHDRDMMLANMELARLGIPILVYPMPACGTTGPASLYGNVALGVAEALSAIVLFQAARPGSPQIFGTAQGVINRRSGLFLEGAPETILQGVAMAEMARHYGLPSTIAGCLTDAKMPGMQAVMEKMLTTLPLFMAGADVIQGIGLLESSMTLSLEQMIIDGEIGALCLRMREGIEVSAARDALADIAAVGPGGHFLKQPSTRAGFRSREYSNPELLDRGTYDEWLALGSPDLLETASRKVAEILAAPDPHPLPPDREAAVRKLMARWMEEGGGGMPE
jgi:trimethylamine--corrinoid protein Co-methyltransferase